MCYVVLSTKKNKKERREHVVAVVCIWAYVCPYIIGSLCYKVTFSRDHQEARGQVLHSGVKVISEGGMRKCKGPEVGVCLMYLRIRSSKATTGSGIE